MRDARKGERGTQGMRETQVLGRERRRFWNQRKGKERRKEKRRKDRMNEGKKRKKERKEKKEEGKGYGRPWPVVAGGGRSWPERWPESGSQAQAKEGASLAHF